MHMRIQKLNSDTKKNLLEDLLKRSPNNYGQYEASGSFCIHCQI